MYFQGALRLAAALAVARLLAGVLDLSHGFWVLLTVLTLLRTSAAETRATAVARAGRHGDRLGRRGRAPGRRHPAHRVRAGPPVVMLVGFAAGPLLGLGWAQALFTLVIALVFAQVSPVDWHLAEARVVDVAVGAAIGLATGLLAWPRGGSGELHRAAGTLPRGRRPGGAGDRRRPHPRRPSRRVRCRRRATPASSPQASWALYQTERHPPAVRRLAGHPARRAPRRPRRGVVAAGVPDRAASLPCVEPLSAEADDVAARYERVADALLRRDHAVLGAAPPEPPRGDWPTDLGTDLYHLADLHVWLDGLRDDLGRIRVDAPDLPNEPARRRRAPA